MNGHDVIAGSMREKVENLEAHMRDMPQAELVTNHYFADGIYARELLHPEGALIVGKVHKREHLLIVTKGRLRIAMNEEVRFVEAPAVLVSAPGTKRALLALEDSVYMTVHRTNKKNLSKIEKEVVEEAPLALFDSTNKLKVKVLS